MGLDHAILNLNTHMNELEQQLTGMIDAQIAYEQSVDDLTESFKKNGKSTDIRSQKGRDNVTAIENEAKAAFAARDAFIAQNQATMGLAGATQAANAAFKASIDNLATQMRQAGLTDVQIHQLLDTWYALANAPNITKSVTVLQRGSNEVSRTVVTDPKTGITRTTQHQFNRYGGLYMAERGLINLSRRADLFPAMSRPTYGFAERGTGGEAFIAKNADHGRSLAIANQAARWHGGQVVAAGGNSGAGAGTARVSLDVGAGANTGVASLVRYLIRNRYLTARVVNGVVVV
jgi:hypothetical protein